MRKIVIISACVVMLAALGFAAWRMYHSNSTEKRSSSPTIPVKWYHVGYDRDGNYITPVSLDPLSRMEFVPVPDSKLPQLVNIDYPDAKKARLEHYDLTVVVKPDIEVFYFSYEDILASLNLIKSGNLLTIDATKTSHIKAKLDDRIFVYIKEPNDSEQFDGYKYSFDGDSRYRFFIYTATNYGTQTIVFEHPNGDMKAEPVIVNVNVSK